MWMYKYSTIILYPVKPNFMCSGEHYRPVTNLQKHTRSQQVKCRKF